MSDIDIAQQLQQGLILHRRASHRLMKPYWLPISFARKSG